MVGGADALGEEVWVGVDKVDDESALESTLVAGQGGSGTVLRAEKKYAAREEPVDWARE